MFSKPLSYEALKAVLHNIKADKRFEISQKMATIRNAEKLVPLKIDKLSFRLSEFAVNQTTFGIRIAGKTINNSWLKSLYREYICLAVNRKAVEYVEYSRSQFQLSSEYMMSTFFGGRSDPIQVYQLMFDADRLLTWPPNAKLQIQHLAIRNGTRPALIALSTVLTESSFSLQSLKIFVNHLTIAEFRDKVVQEAKKVIIVQNSCSFSTNGPNNYYFLPPNTHFENTKCLKPNDFAFLIRYWKISEAAPGRRCSIGIRDDLEDLKFANRTKFNIQTQFDVTEKNGMITIPINRSSEVHVLMEDYNSPQDVYNPPKWIFVMKVVRKRRCSL